VGSADSETTEPELKLWGKLQYIREGGAGRPSRWVRRQGKERLRMEERRKERQKASKQSIGEDKQRGGKGVQKAGTGIWLRACGKK